MSTTYTPAPLDTSSVTLSPALLELTERIAANVHDVWAAARIADGWRYGTARDDARKLHPCLVPYDELTESEKGYDRKTAMETLKQIIKLGFYIGKKSKWRINTDMENLKCPKCGASLPRVRFPTSIRQALWGGWTCKRCEVELDKWLTPIQRSPNG